MTTPDVHAFDSAPELYEAAARRIAESAQRALDERGRFRLVLAGGSTPRGVYEALARAQDSIRWESVECFWGDERCVPPDSGHSNYRTAHEALLRHVPVPPGNLHRMPGEQAPERAAAAYDAELARLLGAVRPDELPEPAFDLVLLGLGEDGHTASLFPGTPALAAEGWATVGEAPPGAPVPARITLTLPALNAARDCLFLVTGAAKRSALEAVLAVSAELPLDSQVLPAARVRPRGALDWFVADL